MKEKKNKGHSRYCQINEYVTCHSCDRGNYLVNPQLVKKTWASFRNYEM